MQAIRAGISRLPRTPIRRLPAKNLPHPNIQEHHQAPMCTTTDLLCAGALFNVGCTVGSTLWPVVSNTLQRYTTPETLLPPLNTPHKTHQRLTDQALLRAVHSVFYSPTTAPLFNEILGIRHDSPTEKSAAGWRGKGTCGAVSMLGHVILNHMGFNPKIVGILEDIDNIDQLYNNPWHGGKGPRHVWIQVDALKTPGEKEEPLWIDFTSRQFTGTSKTPADIETPHGIIGYKGDFLKATGPHKHHWEGATDVTDFFERYISPLEQQLYAPTFSNSVSFWNCTQREALQIQTPLRQLLEKADPTSRPENMDFLIENGILAA